jgi:hypothetical protein
LKFSNFSEKPSKNDQKGTKDEKDKPPTYEIRTHADRAEGLLAANSDGSSDPYVIFSLTGSKDRIPTNHIDNDLSPVVRPRTAT